MLEALEHRLHLLELFPRRVGVIVQWPEIERELSLLALVRVGEMCVVAGIHRDVVVVYRIRDEPLVARSHREGRAERLKRIENLTYEEALTGQVLVGTPDEVTNRLRGLQDELGIDGILAELNCGGLVPHRQVMTALQLLCQEVMPRFH